MRDDPERRSEEISGPNNEALSRREFAEKLPVLSSLPRFLIIDPTSRCNARCVMCHVSFRPPFDRGIDLPLELFDKVAPLIPAAVHINLFSTGEPTIAENIVQLLQETRAKAREGTLIWLCTNGKSLPQDVLECVQYPGMGLQFSVDGGTKEVFESIRRGIKFDQLCRNLELAKARRGDRPYPAFSFSSTISKRNIRDLANIFALAKRYDVEQVIFFEENAEVPEEEIFLLDESDRPIYEAQIPYIDSSGIRQFNGLHFGGVESRRPSGKSLIAPLVCRAPWNVLHLHSDGEVRPCCQFLTGMGNLNENSFEEVWNGEKYVRLRRSFIEQKNFAAECLACTDPLRTWDG